MDIIDTYKSYLSVAGYSQKTVKAYTASFVDFCQYYKNRNINTLTDNEITEYLAVKTKHSSRSTVNIYVSAIKLYYSKIAQNRRINYGVPRQKKEKKLPEVLSQQEIEKIFEVIENHKHKAILFTIYSAGLRISEAVNLKVTDIDSNRNCIRIREAKGRKDRISLLSPVLLEYLRDYYREYRPTTYLFEGQGGGKYSNCLDIAT